jgi:hypothetical protein
MPRTKINREIVTHDELINLFRECKTNRGASEIANACRNRLECKFKTAIAEARTMGVLTVDLLVDLRDLVDPESGESVCPRKLQTHLAHSITHFTAVEKKKKISIPQQTVSARA